MAVSYFQFFVSNHSALPVETTRRLLRHHDRILDKALTQLHFVAGFVLTCNSVLHIISTNKEKVKDSLKGKT